MKFIQLHTKNTSIVYKNSLCSSASVIVLVFIVLSFMIPVLLVSLLSPYSGVADSRILYEQPRLQFKFQHIFVGELLANESVDVVACSTFPSFNARMEAYGRHCESTKYWSVDLDHDTTTDRGHFQLQLDSLVGRVRSFELALFFEADLKHKCPLSPPAVLVHQVHIPSDAQLIGGTVLLKAELQLKQYIEFTCPFPGRNIKTHFRDVVLSANGSAETVEMQQFQVESLLEQLKTNPAYFEMNVLETYFRRDPSHGLRIQLDLDIPQIPARYHLSVWERLGQFWLYFASFFSVSFYVMTKVKDYLFGRHIIRSWEIIPWKKLY